MIHPETLEKHDREAYEFGATILEYADDAKNTYHKYKLKCGHEGKYAIASVRRKIAVCRDCIKERIINEGRTSGLEMVTPYEEINPSKKNTYRFINCGHTKDMVVTVAKAGTSCDECDDIKHQTAAQSLNFTVISGPHKDCNRYTRCNICSNERHIANGSLLDGTATCLVCRANKAIEGQKQAAKKMGIEYVDKDYERGNDFYFFKLQCGHVKSLRTSSTYTGSFVCEICNKSRYNLDFQLYLFEITVNDFSFLKAGIAAEADFRKRTYGLVQGASCRLLYSSPKVPYLECLAKEQKLFSDFKSSRYDKRIIKCYMKSGYTECFHFKSKDKILKYLKELNE